MKRMNIQPTTQYMLDDFDDAFPDQYNALHEQARHNRSHTECDLAKIGRKLKIEPDFGDSLRDPSRLMRRTSKVERRGGATMQTGIDKMTVEIKRARRQSVAVKNQRYQNTPEHRRASIENMNRARQSCQSQQMRRSSEISQFKTDHGNRDLSYRIAFEKYDEDGSGFIETNELQTALIHMGLKIDAAEAKRVMNKRGAPASRPVPNGSRDPSFCLYRYDADANGKLDFEEFKAMSIEMVFNTDSDGLFVPKTTLMRNLETSDNGMTNTDGLDLSFEAINRGKVAVKPGDEIGSRPRRDPLRDRTSMLATMGIAADEATPAVNIVKERRASLRAEAIEHRAIANTARAGGVPSAVLGQLVSEVGDATTDAELAQLNAYQAGLERASRSGVRTPTVRRRTSILGRSQRPATSQGHASLHESLFPGARPTTAPETHRYEGRLSRRAPARSLFARPVTAGSYAKQKKHLHLE